MKSKGLGTGLGAIFGEAAIEEASNDFEYVPLQRIEPRPDQPRSLFQQEKIDELTASIREHGVLLPLTVRRMKEGYYQIISGERRWRAARAVGLTELPVRIVDADDQKATELALVENLQREDLNPIEEAKGFKTLIDEFNMTQEEVAQRVSKSRPAVANALRLLALPDKIIKYVINGEISAGSARALLALKNNETILSAVQTVIKNNMSVRDVESLVKKMNRESKEQKKQITGDINYLDDIKKQLETTLGRRVTIKQGKYKGRIELEYYGPEDLDALLNDLAQIGNNRKEWS